MEKMFQLEVGKTYVNWHGTKVKIVYASNDNSMFAGTISGNELCIYHFDGESANQGSNLVSEYKEKVKQYLLVQVNKHGQALTLTSSLSSDLIENLKTSYIKTDSSTTYHVIEREIDKPNE